MSETNLNITIYTQQNCKESDRTVAEFMVKQVDFYVRNIDEDPDARLALEALVKGIPTPKQVVAPTVVAECSCGKHLEWWSGYNSDRSKRLFAMLRHLDNMNQGVPSEDPNDDQGGPEHGLYMITPH